MEHRSATLPAAPDAELPPGFLDQYTLAVEMADRVSARRGSANSFFLTVNTALTAILGGTNLKWYVSLAGIAFAATWWVLLLSYRDVERAKAEVILTAERRLPVQLLADERSLLNPASPDARRLAGLRDLGQIEQLVPALFALIYVFVLINKLSA